MNDTAAPTRRPIGRLLRLAAWTLPLLAAVVLNAKAPPWQQPLSITVRLEEGRSRVLGAEELAADRADHRHLQLTHSAGERWTLINLSRERRLLVRGQDESEFRPVRSLTLDAGIRFVVTGSRFTVGKPDPDGLTLVQETEAGATLSWRYDGRYLYGADGTPAPDRGEGVIAWLKTRVGDWLGHRRPLTLGGNLVCADRLPLAGSDPDAYRILSWGGGWLLRPGDGAVDQRPELTVTASPRPLPGGEAFPVRLDDLAYPVRPGDTLIAGYSHFRLLPEASGLTFFPIGRSERRLVEPGPTPGLEWGGRPAGLFTAFRARVLHWLAILCLPWLPLTLVWLVVPRPSFGVAPSAGDKVAMGLAVTVAAACVAFYLSGEAVSAGWPLAALWLAVGAWLALPWRSRGAHLLLTLTALLLGGGLLVQLQLHLGAEDSHWGLHLIRTASLGGAALWGGWSLHRLYRVYGPSLFAALGPALLELLVLGGGVFLLWKSRGLPVMAFADPHWAQGRDVLLLLAFGIGAWAWHRRGAAARSRWAGGWGPAVYLGLLFILALGGLIAQYLFGGEGGVSGFQPVELAKLALLATMAQALARRRMGEGWYRETPRLQVWLGFLWPVLLMGAIVAVVLAVIRDFSPFALLLFWVLGLAWAYLRSHDAARVRRAGALVLALVAALLGLAGWGVHQAPRTVEFLGQSDRIVTWAEPRLHPHSGDQVRRGMRAAREGGWLGQPDTGGNPYRLNGNRLMDIPAIQDDFAPDFLLNRFGLAAGTLLLALQMALLAALVLVARRLHAVLVVGGQGDYLRQRLGWFAYFLLYGGAALLGGHFVVSWGSNTGLLPVMGQPMTFVSSAGSHLVLFALPLLLTGVVLAEESQRETD